MTEPPPVHDQNHVPVPQPRSPFTRALLAGALAGTTVDLSLYPLDTLKTRLQSSSGFTRSGGFRGIYSGVGSALIGSAPGAALFFVSYEGVKAWFHPPGLLGKDDHDGWTEPFAHMAAASVGEVAACAVRVPTEVVKQRAQALQGTSSAAVLRQIWDRRKIAGVGVVGVWRELYTGWSVTVMREVPFTVIQFPIWEALKESRRRKTGREKVSAWENADDVE
ncbi:MAG: S-adenosylmethionine transporter [Ramalina farinacea]|uniref:S-adenosylmethionine transporter n=1 Tax=Ramalina farinacea TaxID=258253 RepID=A0AA43TTT4_9LECA|nr:S-adenosylmethionine transporter [Ramalina farinacea]